jgi:uncharacterized protein YcfJ
MLPMFRTALVAAALCLAVAAPAAAQQATPGVTPPASAESSVPPAVADAVQDLDAMVQRLSRDLQQMTESARQGAQDMLNRKSPYVITTDQLAMVAVGALAGALVVDMLGGGGLATLTGAAIGGVAGHWFYTQPDPSAGLLPTVQGG